MGFHWIKVKGRRADIAEAPILIIGPHTSFFDVALEFVAGLPSPVAGREQGSIPVLGSR